MGKNTHKTINIIQHKTCHTCKQKNIVVLHLTITAKIGNGNLAILKSKKKNKQKILV